MDNLTACDGFDRELQTAANHYWLSACYTSLFKGINESDFIVLISSNDLGKAYVNSSIYSDFITYVYFKS